jgi:Holliday junction resolvasome RuvABC endonuclease subunit
MIYRVLSLDIATTTGWAFIFGQARGKFEYGLIKTNAKFSQSQRLAYFRNELQKLLLEFRPSHVVMEDIYSGVNINTTKLLAKFAGVAQECCLSITGIEPYIVQTTKVKSFFKARSKEKLFDFMVELLGWEDDDIQYKKHNDITDAIAQLMYFYHEVLKARNFRTEKDYGYLYEV